MAYILGIIRNHRCFLLRINCMPDHLHMLVDVHPSIALSALVQEIKQQSSIWMKSNAHFCEFDGWNAGYYAFSIGEKDVEACKQYIINQEIHHQSAGLIQETRMLAAGHNLRWDERDW